MRGKWNGHIQPDTRKCPKCGITKDSVKDFYWRNTPSGARIPVSCCKECTALWSRKFYENNKQSVHERSALWLKNHPSQAKEIWAKSAKKTGAANKAKYRSTELGKLKAVEYANKRRARINRALTENSHLVTNEWMAELCANHGHKCYYCRGDGPLAMDHVIPLALGGKHERDNILPACRACNTSKGHRLISEWRPWIDIPLYGLDLATG